MTRFFDRLITGAAVFAFAASSFLILINVVNRYLILGLMRSLAGDYPVLNGSYQYLRGMFGNWSVMADEVPGYLLVWISFLGAYLVFRRDGHISFTMLVDKLPKLGRRIVTVINSMLLGIFLIVLLQQSIRMIRVSGSTEIETAEIAQGWFMSILPIAACLLFLALVINTIAILKSKSIQEHN